MLRGLFWIIICGFGLLLPLGNQGQAHEAQLDFVDQGQHFRLSLSEVGFDGIDPTTLERDRFYEWLERNVEKRVNQKSRSAYFKEGRVRPHRIGRKVNRASIDHMLDLIHFYMNRPIALPVHQFLPKLTTEQCFRLKQKQLASYTTWFNPRNRNRSHNILLSTKAIDHWIVQPGEEFSFNRVVGQRTPERGYREAKVIVRGEFSEGIGGGICQTSSTLFNSVDQAGLEITRRYSHSRRVTYVPKRRDAAVSWGGLDFCFRNQLNEPVVIVPEVMKGRLTISIYGPETILYQPRRVPKLEKKGIEED
jgi:vancomycin resistance protein YoaR